LQKVHVENFFQKNRQKFRCQFFLDFFCFIAVSGVSQRWEFKNTTKMFCKTSRVEKLFTKHSTKNPKQTDCLSNFLLSHFWRFSVREVQKHHKKISKNKSDPDPVLASDPPTHHGGRRFFFIGGPLLSRALRDGAAVLPLAKHQGVGSASGLFSHLKRSSAIRTCILPFPPLACPPLDLYRIGAETGPSRASFFISQGALARDCARVGDRVCPDMPDEPHG
jgi:hypothetical protein